jgi:hypothetical protein
MKGERTRQHHTLQKQTITALEENTPITMLPKNKKNTK